VSQLSAKFTYDNGQMVPASVQSFVRLDVNLPTKRMQSIEVNLLPPQGSRVLAGSGYLSLIHLQHPCSSASAHFVFTDPAAPRVVEISGSSGTGENVLRVGMSAPTDLTIVISDSQSWRSGVVLVDGVVTILQQVSYRSASRQTTLSFTSPARDSGGIVYGLVIFGEYSEACSSSCCSDQTCGDSCANLQTACFTLDYFNDFEAFFTSDSELRGPEFGGESVTMTLHNLPVMESDLDMAVITSQLMVLFGSADEYKMGQVEVVSASRSGVVITVRTPPWYLRAGLTQELVQALLIHTSRPDVGIEFSYVYEAVPPRVASASPTTGFDNARTEVYVTIENFLYPSAVRVAFGEFLVADTDVTIWPATNREKTEMSFLVPITAHGQYTVEFSRTSSDFSDFACWCETSTFYIWNQNCTFIRCCTTCRF
jgi:hypothetical protein